jgi:hypothetical protein
MELRGIEQCMRAFGEEALPMRGVCLADRVVLALDAVAPSVEYAEDDGARRGAAGRRSFLAHLVAVEARKILETTAI